MTAPHWTDALARLGACSEAVEWALGYASLSEAWAACERGDRMLWLAGRVSGEVGSPERRRLTLAACGCARIALPYVPAGEGRPLECIETAERYGHGDPGVTLEMVQAAARAAEAAAAEAAAAGAAAEAATAWAAMLRRCADIVREHYPEPPELP